MASGSLRARGGAAARFAGGPVLVTLGALVLMLTVLVRTTVLSAQFDGQAVERAGVYTQFYDQVLPGPLERDLTANLPIPASGVASALRTVVPPATLRAVVTAELRQLTGYLTGARRTVDLWAGWSPVAANVRRLAANYVRGAVSDAQLAQMTSTAQLQANLRRFATALAHGEVPVAIPTVRLGTRVSAQVQRLLLAQLPGPVAPAVQRQLAQALRSGNMVGVLRAVAPALFSGGTRAQADLQRYLSAVGRLMQTALTAVRAHPAYTALRAAHRLVRTGTVAGYAGGAASIAVGVGVMAVTEPRRPNRRRRLRRRLAATALATTVAGAVLGWLAATLLPDPLRTVASEASLPPSVSAMVQALDRQLRAGIAGRDALLLAGAGGIALLLASPDAFTWLRRGARRLARVPRTVPVTVVGLAAVTMPAVLLAVQPWTAAVRTCDGYRQLCSRRYDQVTVLAAHNAMASADQGFFAPFQGGSLTAQLDAGARALLIDTHYWRAPGGVNAALAHIPAATRRRVAPLVQAAASHRRGVWLCHVLCQEGALNAVSAMRTVGRWLQEHPDNVVTLIVEDHTTAADTMAVFRQAGLTGEIFTPPANPGSPWPTLGQMISAGHRLVVMPQTGDRPGTWYRNFYRYAAETYWRVSSPTGFACTPGRGPARGRLFLLNHFVTAGLPDEGRAEQVNSLASVLGQARRCERERSMVPTFVAVNFVGIGQAQQAVRALNGL